MLTFCPRVAIPGHGAAAAHWPEVLTVLRRVLEPVVHFYFVYHQLEFWIGFRGFKNVSPELAAQHLFPKWPFSHQFSLVRSGLAPIYGIARVGAFIDVYWIV